MVTNTVRVVIDEIMVVEILQIALSSIEGDLISRLTCHATEPYVFGVNTGDDTSCLWVQDNPLSAGSFVIRFLVFWYLGGYSNKSTIVRYYDRSGIH